MKQGVTMKNWLVGISLMVLGGSMSACAIGGVSWKEEVLLHDGKKIIVDRSQTRGGNHEIGQPPPVKEHTISFALPNSDKTITWTSEYGEDVGRANFNLLALHVLNGTPYVVTSPNLCLSYNKWGRPNPPYVFFRYDGKTWQRIPLSEFPIEFKTINVAASTLADENRLTKLGFVSAEKIKELNNEFTQPEYKTILRTAYPTAAGGCEEMAYDGKGGWIGIGWFRDQRSREACLLYCARYEITPQFCPCDRFFKEGK